MISVVVCNAQNTDEHCRKLFEAAKNTYNTKGKQAAKAAFERVYKCGSAKVKADAQKWFEDQEKKTQKQTAKTQNPKQKPQKKVSTPFNNFKCLQTLEGHSNWVKSVSWSPDGKYLASGSWDKTVGVWNLYEDIKYSKWKNMPSNVYSSEVSPDEKYSTEILDYIDIVIKDTKSGETLKTLQGQSNLV